MSYVRLIRSSLPPRHSCVTTTSRRCFLRYLSRVGSLHLEPHPSHGASRCSTIRSYANRPDAQLARICRPRRADPQTHHHQHVGWPARFGSAQLDLETHHQGRTSERYVFDAVPDDQAPNFLDSRGQPSSQRIRLPVVTQPIHGLFWRIPDLSHVFPPSVCLLWVSLT